MNLPRAIVERDRPACRAAALWAGAIIWALAGDVWAASRIKDIADFEGVRENQLVGYGLVVGLDGTGDSLRNAPFTRQSLESMLERLGVNTRDATLNTDTVAAVMVSANLPPFARHGSRIDVTVSALGDAESLLGGTLLVTPLLGADGEVYAVGQGSVTVGGFSATGQAETVTKGVPTSGRIPNGAIVEREVGFELAHLERFNIALRNPDFTTARRIAEAINGRFGDISQAIDPGTVVLGVPADWNRNVMDLLTEVEQLSVSPDQPAKIVINETTGVIVIGDDVRVDRVGIAHGNLTIRVSEAPQVSQPAPFSEQGNTVVVPRTDITVDEAKDAKLKVVDGGVSLQTLVDALNGLGVGPRDLISILQALKAAGALQAVIEVM